MPLVGEMIEKLRSIDVDKIIDDCIKELTDFIIDLNREQLYEKGDIDVKYPGIKWHYADSTIKQKLRSAKYKKTEFITLRWTGEFYESFVIEIREDDFLIRATDEKWGFLESDMRFENALGLTPESKEKLRAALLPIFVKKLKDEL